MGIKRLFLLGMCAISISVFADGPVIPTGGTLLFLETFNAGATAESNADIAAYKVNGHFYTLLPGNIDVDWFSPGNASTGEDIHPDDTKPAGSIRWAYPNNSDGTIWKPYKNESNPPAFEFELNTSGFNYAYLSLASLFWGDYRAYYSFDNWVTENEFSRDLFYRSSTPMVYRYSDCGLAASQGYPYKDDKGDCWVLQNWWYDQYIENIGGKNAVAIRIVCISGSPLELDDVQISGYENEIIFSGALSSKIEEVDKFYELNKDNEEEKYCPTKLAVLPELLEAANAVNEKAGATQSEINEVLSPLSQAYTSVLTKDELDMNTIMDFENALAGANEIDLNVANAAFIPAATKQEFENALEKANGIDEYCDEALVVQLTETLATLSPLIQNYISIDNAQTEAFGLYPNPASDIIHITGSLGGSVYIFNAAGQQVHSEINYQGGSIDVSSLTPGIYTVAYERQSIPFVKK